MPEGESVVPVSDSTRILAIVVYLLYLLSLPLGLPAVVGVIIAYVKRDEAVGTVYESHYANAIETFWVFAVGLVAAIPLCFVLVGFALIAALFVWMVFRTVRGLVRALDGRAY